MKVLVIGANGKVGRHIVSILVEEGYEPRAMIRNKSQRSELEKRGGEVVIADLEGNFEHVFDDCEAVIFTAGSGGHTGPDKTELVDRQGAVRAIDLARKKGIQRFIMISSTNADAPEEGPASKRHYYLAKGDADNHLRKSGLNYTIIRPGRLSTDPGTGKIEAAKKIKNRSHAQNIPREDVARTVVCCLGLESTQQRVFEILSGDVKIDQALELL